MDFILRNYKRNQKQRDVELKYCLEQYGLVALNDIYRIEKYYNENKAFSVVEKALRLFCYTNFCDYINPCHCVNSFFVYINSPAKSERFVSIFP